MILDINIFGHISLILSIHPFYVYAYAFGDGMVNALFSKYKNKELDF